MHVINYLLNYC